MNFNSWQFLVFFPVVAVGYFGITMRVRRVLPALSNTLSQVFLLGVSLFFYACWNPVYLGLILSLIASSKTSRPEIENVIGQSVGPQIERLENEFRLIRRIIPIFAKPGTRQIRYVIEDNFLKLWFRFIYKYRSAIEIGNYTYVREIIERDYSTYAGLVLEKYFREKLMQSGEYSAIGTYWEKGNLNEVDLVAVNDDKKRMLVGEVKLNPRELRLSELERKAAVLSASRPKYKVELVGFSVKDM
ncbi:hypothetical protein AGMMS49944_23440 [Spirochaetia bacterium]|nr:hypothetical protein AGMMS49944_23440 [Spirochaetia bacterium]